MIVISLIFDRDDRLPHMQRNLVERYGLDFDGNDLGARITILIYQLSRS
ncbi:hypothetical protein [Cohnella cholangitidis]|nr:hypothetical protein [Cohnella cholangitidis]